MASSKKLPANKQTANQQHDYLSNSVRQQLVSLFKTHQLSRPHLLVAFSGGLDSTVLLHLLSKLSATLPFHLTAMHVHHGLSEQADNWAAACQSFCAKLDIPFKLFKVTVDQQSGLGVEAAARKARYDALAIVDADIVCLGHHQDDQAETLLLQMARGAGVKGMAAMADFDVKRALFRPLLKVARNELQHYAEQHGLRWVDDESNGDTRYDRNFLRHQVLPLLAQQYPSIQQCLARTAGHMAEANQLLNDLAALDADDVIDEAQQYGALKLNALTSLNEVRQKNLIRWWLHRNQLQAPSTAVLAQITAQLQTPRLDTNIKIKVAEHQYVMRYEALAYLVDEPQNLNHYQLVWQGEEVMVLPDLSRLFFRKEKGLGLSLNKLSTNMRLEIKKRVGGEKIKTSINRPSTTLKHLLQSHRIPPWQRERLPLIYWNNSLVSVPGIAVEASYQAGLEEYGLVVQWQASCKKRD